MISEIYKNSKLYYNMMQDFLEKKITVLEFKKRYFSHGDGQDGYPSGNTDDLKVKLNNEEIFKEQNAGLLNNLKDQVNALEFSRKYQSQRNSDLNQDGENGYTYEDYEKKIKSLIGNDKIFKEKYYNHLYENAWTDNSLNILQEYEKGAKELNIQGELFFMGIWNFIDEYIREYTPSDAVYFNSETDVDEKTLQDKIQAAFDVLERNKEKWEYDQDQSIKM